MRARRLSRAAGRTRQGLASTWSYGVCARSVRVERELTLGLKWQVETRVVRVTPAGSAVLLEVPLLAGESVTTADVRVADGKALVSLGPLASQAGWTSSWRRRTPSDCAPGGGRVGRDLALPLAIWHVEAEGIPVSTFPINGRADARMAAVARRDGVPGDRPARGLPGQTLTIDRSALALAPGLRATDATLDVTIRSSRGAQHAISIPEDAELQSVAINHAVQPIRQQGVS